MSGWPIFVAGLAIGAWIPSLVHWWQCQTRGEFHCKVCKQVSPLPKDDE